MLGPFLDLLRARPLAIVPAAGVPPPLGLTLHLCDHLVRLFAEATDKAGVAADLHLAAIMPLLELVAAPIQAAVRTRIGTGVVDRLLDHSFPDPEDLPPDSLGTQEVAWDDIVSWMFTKAADASISDDAREQLYRTRRRILNRQKKHDRYAAGDMPEELAEVVAAGGIRKRQALDLPPDLPLDDAIEKNMKRRAKKARKRAEKEEKAAAAAAAADDAAAAAKAKATGAAAAKPAKTSKKGRKAAVETTPDKRPSTAGGASSAKAKKKKKQQTPPKGAEAATTPMRGGDSAALTPRVKGILRTPNSPASGRRISWGVRKTRLFKKKAPPAHVGDGHRKGNGPQ
mmetsp:Transcript_14059/g.41771  ORF Transcript_14059/g.41771 Transcript_14059/m.41771 type:complete len:342 (+) Transcript_14059:93-1118(+)